MSSRSQAWNTVNRQIRAVAATRGIDDQTRKDIVRRVTGKTSMADCSPQELGKILTDITGSNNRSTGKFRSSKPYVRKIWALWGELRDQGKLENPSREALIAFVERMTGKANPEWLTPAQAAPVIEALKDWVERGSLNSESLKEE